MHDPMTVAFYIKSPFWKRCKLSGRKIHFTLATIWHVDPESDRTDDSCGWFIRARHCDKAVLDKIERAFDFEWDADYGGWFNKDSAPRLSPMAITIQMFQHAAYQIRGRKFANKFMQKNLFQILHLAENNVDSLYTDITGRYGFEVREVRIKTFASIVYPYIMRTIRPWYRHPKWHLHHWQIQVHCLQLLKRIIFERCAKCGGMFSYKEASNVCGNWSGTKIWHTRCEGSREMETTK